MSAKGVVDHVHQILITDSGAIPPQLPDIVRKNCAAAQNIFSTSRYNLWSSVALRRFIGQNFDQKVVDAFDILTPYSYKSDLARFCLLYTFGGAYIDLGVRVLERFDIESESGIVAFRDIQFITDSWSTMQTGLILATPRRSEFKRAIEYIIQNCASKFYGSNPLYPTGPVVFGKAMASILSSNPFGSVDIEQSVGECRCLSPETEPKNIVYVTKNGRMVAWRNKTIGGDLRHLGLNEVNNYNEIWRARQVYGENTRRWLGSDPLLCTQGGAQIVEGGAIEILMGMSGQLVYGPYVNLEAGTFVLKIDFGDEFIFNSLLIDVAAEFGKVIIESYKLKIDDVFEKNTLLFKLIFTKHYSNVEFRITAFGDFQGKINCIELIKINEEADEQKIYTKNRDINNIDRLVNSDT